MRAHLASVRARARGRARPPLAAAVGACQHDAMRVLGLVAFVQLLLGVAGLKKALREGRVADVPFAEKRSKKQIEQRHWTDGTALSAPTPMLVIQGIASIVLILGRRPPVFLRASSACSGRSWRLAIPSRRYGASRLSNPTRT